MRTDFLVVILVDAHFNKSVAFIELFGVIIGDLNVKEDLFNLGP